jgi:hypothetical protein
VDGVMGIFGSTKKTEVSPAPEQKTTLPDPSKKP